MTGFAMGSRCGPKVMEMMLNIVYALSKAIHKDISEINFSKRKADFFWFRFPPSANMVGNTIRQRSDTVESQFFLSIILCLDTL